MRYSRRVLMVRPAVLSRELVLSAAVTVVDRDGLEALSMRKLGEELGVEAMSLYRYVESKAALLDGVVEAILSEMVVREPEGALWAERVKLRARALRAALRAHPNALSLFATRPAVTPSSIEHVESALTLLESAGFSAVDAIRAFQSTLAFTVGHTVSVYSIVAPAERSAPAYAGLDAKKFPRMIAASKLLARWDADAEFEFGLEALVRGLEARLSEQRASKRGKRGGRAAS